MDDKISERQRPLVHQLLPGAGPATSPAAIDEPNRSEGIRGLGALRVVAFVSAIVLSVAAVYTNFTWPFAALAWLVAFALMLGKRAGRRPPVPPAVPTSNPGPPNLPGGLHGPGR